MLVLVFAFGREDPVQWVLASAVAVGLAGWALRDLVAPVRLAADAEGSRWSTGSPAVAGWPGTRSRRYAWTAANASACSSEMLEIDADDALYLFSMHDLRRGSPRGA